MTYRKICNATNQIDGRCVVFLMKQFCEDKRGKEESDGVKGSSYLKSNWLRNLMERSEISLSATYIIVNLFENEYTSTLTHEPNVVFRGMVWVKSCRSTSI